MAKENKPEKELDKIEDVKEICGIIMPISGNDGYTAEHWNDVRAIIEEVVREAGFLPNLVSDADEIGIIHNRIVGNIYSNPIVISDVSSKNPNVMFELGLRLAFDKATIIIKDDETNYNFDTGVIEHLTYPRDLRYSVINKFKSKLKEKLMSTYYASKKPEYSTFLKNFVQYKPKLETEEVSTEKYMLKQLEDISKQISQLRSSPPPKALDLRKSKDLKNYTLKATILTSSKDLTSELIDLLSKNNLNEVGFATKLVSDGIRCTFFLSNEDDTNQLSLLIRNNYHFKDIVIDIS